MGSPVPHKFPAAFPLARRDLLQYPLKKAVLFFCRDNVALSDKVPVLTAKYAALFVPDTAGDGNSVKKFRPVQKRTLFYFDIDKGPNIGLRGFFPPGSQDGFRHYRDLGA
jgi:hypothetical protein